MGEINVNEEQNSCPGCNYLESIQESDHCEICGTWVEVEIEVEKIKIIYDVCNDYKLEIARKQDINLSKYSSSQAGCFGKPVTVYTHIEHDEIHYVKGPEGLHGKYFY